MALIEDLYTAIEKLNVTKVKSLIKAGVDVNQKDKNGETALTMASNKGHAQIATALIAANADVNHLADNGESPLIKASRAGEEHVVSVLIAANADVNQKLTSKKDPTGQKGANALFYACGGGYTSKSGKRGMTTSHWNIAAALVAANADVDSRPQEKAKLFGFGFGDDDAEPEGPIDLALAGQKWSLAFAMYKSPKRKIEPLVLSSVAQMLQEVFFSSPEAGAATAAAAIFKLAVARDAAGNAKLTDVHRPGETLLANLWNGTTAAQRPQPDPVWAAIEQASSRYQERDIAEAGKQTEALETLCTKHAGGKGNQARYIATHDDLKRQPSYPEIISKIQGISGRVHARQKGVKPEQTAKTLEQLYANCHAIKPRFDAFVTNISKMSQNKLMLPDALKGSFRSLQKAAKSTSGEKKPEKKKKKKKKKQQQQQTQAGAADDVDGFDWADASACKDIVRGISEMPDLGKGGIFLDLFMGCDVEEALHNDGGDSATAGVDEKIVIVWYKDRWTLPTNGGWADSLVNFYFADDKTKTICELQLPHSDMMAIREAFGAHNGYDELRKAVELLTLTGHADIVAAIEAKAESAVPQPSTTQVKPLAAKSSSSSGGSVSNDVLQQCLDAIQALKVELASVKADNLLLSGKVEQLEKAGPTLGLGAEDAGFGFRGGDDLDDKVTLLAEEVEAIKGRMDAVEAATSTKKLPMPTSNASGLELEVHGLTARLERLEVSSMTVSAANAGFGGGTKKKKTTKGGGVKGKKSKASKTGSN